MHDDQARERDIERRLGWVESPEPPADLLDRIRADIPEHLRPAGPGADEAPPRRRRYRLLAASLFLAVAGGMLAYRVLREAPDPLSTAASSQPAYKTPATPAPVAREVGAGGEPLADELRAEPETTPSSPAPAQSPAGTEAVAQPVEGMVRQETGTATGERRAAPRTAPEPTLTEEEAQQLAAIAEPQAMPPSGTRGQPELVDRERLEAMGHVGADDRDAGAAGAAPSAPLPPIASEGMRAIAPEREPARRDRPRQIEVGVPSPAPAPSTGGAAEPNDQPWGDMFFRPYGTNPFVDSEDDPRSTFGLDVDTGSYTLARAYLERGQLPPPEAIRVEEFVNYFDYRDPPPRRGEFTLTAEGAPSPWRRGPRYELLRIGLRGRDVAAAQRPEATLIFVVDVSGSMARDGRLQLVQGALRLLLDQLRPGDRVGLVVYGNHGQVLLEPSGDLAAVRRALAGLSTGGSTNAEEGLVLAYDLARRTRRPEGITRLVLCSDGVANVGRTGPESILERIGREAGEGIELTTVGFGMGNYNDVLMEQLADRGDGNYAYVDTLDEARRVFVDNLAGTLQTLAADARIQVEFDPAVVTRYRLLGYENRDVADHRFRDDTVDAGELGAGHRVSALYEVKLAEEAPRRRPLAEVRLRYRSRATGRMVEDSLKIGRSELAPSWPAASPSLRLAALAAELAEVLKRSYWAREIRPEELRQRARDVERELSGDRDVAELVRLVERAAALVDWTEAPPE